MTLNEIFNGIRPGIDIDNSADLVDDYTLDSFDVIVLISEIERVYGITVTVNDIKIDNFRTKGAVIEMIERNGGVL